MKAAAVASKAAISSANTTRGVQRIEGCSKNGPVMAMNVAQKPICSSASCVYGTRGSVWASDHKENLALTATAQDVGAACAANRIAVAIPCHRVVKSDGSISGYRWGVDRKRRLINMEGVTCFVP